MTRVLLAAVLVLVTALGWSIWRAEVHKGSVASHKHRAEQLAGELDSWRAAAVRDALSADATDTARAAVAAQTTEHQTRAERVETIAHAPRPPVPDACPVPDPDLLRELAEGRGRIRAAEDRLRGLRGAEDRAAE